MNKSTRKPRFEMMYKAILSLKTEEDCKNFFKDLCTQTELRAMEQRFHVAWLLNKGMIYNDILAETGASSATISRVKRSMESEAAGGYAVVFESLADEIAADPRGPKS